MNKNELIEYIATLLNIDTSPTYIYMDMSDELNNVKDYISFKKEFKELIGSLKSQLEYKNAFQKFLIIMETYNDKLIALSPLENVQIENFGDILFSKITDVCELVRRGKTPTVAEIISTDFANTKCKEGKFFTEKEQKLIGLIGDSREIYRLGTQNKPLLRETIKRIILELVKKKKTETLIIENNNQKRLS